MVFGATTFRQFVEMLAESTEDSDVRDPWVTRMRNMPATVVSSTLEGDLDWPDATVARGDAVDVVRRLKEESAGAVAFTRQPVDELGADERAGLVDRVQVTIFPVITGSSGTDPIFGGAGDFDLELMESRNSTGTPKSSSTDRAFIEPGRPLAVQGPWVAGFGNGHPAVDARSRPDGTPYGNGDQSHDEEATEEQHQTGADVRANRLLGENSIEARERQRRLPPEEAGTRATGRTTCDAPTRQSAGAM